MALTPSNEPLFDEDFDGQKKPKSVLLLFLFLSACPLCLATLKRIGWGWPVDAFMTDQQFLLRFKELLLPQIRDHTVQAVNLRLDRRVAKTEDGPTWSMGQKL